jgi:hypothetical protein
MSDLDDPSGRQRAPRDRVAACRPKHARGPPRRQPRDGPGSNRQDMYPDRKLVGTTCPTLAHACEFRRSTQRFR